MYKEHVERQHKGNPDQPNIFMGNDPIDHEVGIGPDVEFQLMFMDYMDATDPDEAQELYGKIKDFVFSNIPDDPRYPNLHGLSDEDKEAAIAAYKALDDKDRENAIQQIMSFDYQMKIRDNNKEIKRLEEAKQRSIDEFEALNDFEFLSVTNPLNESDRKEAFKKIMASSDDQFMHFWDTLEMKNRMVTNHENNKMIDVFTKLQETYQAFEKSIRSADMSVYEAYERYKRTMALHQLPWQKIILNTPKPNMEPFLEMFRKNK